jgi:hypothetical protein
MLKGLVIVVFAMVNDVSASDAVDCRAYQNNRQSSTEIPYLCATLHDGFTILESDLGAGEVGCRLQPSPRARFPNIYQQVTNTFPRGCGYRWRGFNLDAFRVTVARFINTGEVLCGGLHHSMCTSAVFLAFLSEMRRRHLAGNLSRAQLLAYAQVPGEAYNLINGTHEYPRPDRLVQRLGLGTGSTLRGNQISNPSNANQRLQEGDLLQFWRHDDSGHSVVFGGYQRDTAGRITGICYWSSNVATNGYGRQCESTSGIDRIIYGRISS